MRHRARRPLLDLATAHPARAVVGLGLVLGVGAGVYTTVSFVEEGQSGSPAAGRHTPPASRGLDRSTLPTTPSSAGHGPAGPSRSPAETRSPGEASDGPTSRPSDPLSPLRAPSTRDVRPSVSPTGVDTFAGSLGSNTPAADQDPPNTSLSSSFPTGRSAVFTFAADEPATFQCSLDDAGYAPCSSPRAYDKLHPGWHTFSVRAVDPAGNLDPSPAQARWHATGPSEGADVQ